MKHILMRRQVLKIVGGMAFSPWSLPAESAQTDRVQKTVATLLAATEEGSILQIDIEDLCDTLKLCGSSPACFTATHHDAEKLLDTCRNALVRMHSHRIKAAVVVCSGNGKNFQLTNCAEVFTLIRNAMDESAYQLFGAVFDTQLVDAMSVTWLAGAPDD